MKEKKKLRTNPTDLLIIDSGISKGLENRPIIVNEVSSILKNTAKELNIEGNSGEVTRLLMGGISSFESFLRNSAKNMSFEELLAGSLEFVPKELKENPEFVAFAESMLKRLVEGRPMFESPRLKNDREENNESGFFGSLGNLLAPQRVTPEGFTMPQKDNNNQMMQLRDIATSSAVEGSNKKIIMSTAGLLLSFGWSLISVNNAMTGSDQPMLYSFMITALLNTYEMMGVDWALTPVLDHIDGMDDKAREKIRLAVQSIYIVTIALCYLAEAAVVGMGTWDTFEGMTPMIVKLLSTAAITGATVVGTDLSANVLYKTVSQRIKRARQGSGRPNPVTKPPESSRVQEPETSLDTGNGGRGVGVRRGLGLPVRQQPLVRKPSNQSDEIDY